MFKIDQRVKLIRKLAGFGKGAQGVVTDVDDDDVIVEIDQDENGAAVQPPESMPPEDGDTYYAPVKN